ncbi:hypothetical protein A6C57_08555 [Fibrella sp. ES10-3-2-2]|nr:hypothetical protein A6C57_08555 [Fibrella sp. ES10-3-2-2]
MRKSVNLIVLVILLCILTGNHTQAQQKPTYRTTIRRANNVNAEKVLIYNTVNNSNKDKVLLVSKYINFKKPVAIRQGGVTYITNVKKLLRGDSIVNYMNIKNIVTLKLVKNTLSVSSKVKSIDQKLVAQVLDNKLIGTAGFSQVITERYLEVVDKYDIPVLQIILNKKLNMIEVNGVFFSDTSYVILAGDAAYSDSYPKQFLLMSDSERNAVMHKVLINSKQINRLIE